MRLVRGLAGALLWILSALLGLVGIVCCLTIILLPLGIPIIGYARKAFTLSLKLMLPRAVTHPVATTEDSLRKRGRRAKKEVAAKKRDAKKARKWGKKKMKQVRKKLPFRD
jgi:hypothetical protein